MNCFTFIALLTRVASNLCNYFNNHVAFWWLKYEIKYL